MIGRLKILVCSVRSRNPLVVKMLANRMPLSLIAALVAVGRLENAQLPVLIYTGYRKIAGPS